MVRPARSRTAGATAQPVAPRYAGPAAAGGAGPTVASYLGAFSPGPSWRELCSWPPDVFACANLVLDHTEAYRFAVAPPAGMRWPPDPEWNRRVAAAAAEWRTAAGEPGAGAPDAVARIWDVVIRNLAVPLGTLRLGEHQDVWQALLTLHAMADEACSTLVASDGAGSDGGFEGRAWELLSRRGSLSRISPARIRVTPKTHFASRGITIRSFSRYLALNYESVEVQWRRVDDALRSGKAPVDRRRFNLVLLPWPLQVDTRAFRPIEGPLENMDPGTFGFFEFDPGQPLDLDLMERVVRAALAKVRRIDALLLPEASIDRSELAPIENLLRAFGVVSLIAGVRERTRGSAFSSNYVHLSIRTPSGWQRFRQDKHHRWCLDEAQIRQYHLTRVLKPAKQWWEAIELSPRTVQIIDSGGGVTTAPLICEDLARMDEVTDLLRRIGPSLVVALLLDGPQLIGRWPCRYASVLADEPGSAVLTLTSFGMAARSRPRGAPRSRAVALWSDSTTGLHQLELERGAAGVLLTASVGAKTVWTADGRRHDANTPTVALAAVHQLRAAAD